MSGTNLDNISQTAQITDYEGLQELNLTGMMPFIELLTDNSELINYIDFEFKQSRNNTFEK